MTSDPAYVVRTLGCKANAADSQLIEADLRTRGCRPWDGVGSVSVCVVNSCTVTDEADRRTRSLVARLRREHPGARVVVTGCAAEVGPERLAGLRGVDCVVGNRDKQRLAELALGGSPGGGGSPRGREWPGGEEWFRPPPCPAFPAVPAIQAAQGNPGVAWAARTRAFLKIQEGCDAFCTFCVIPYARGPGRSLQPRAVVERVRTLAAPGVREVVLTGTNLGEYGRDPGNGRDPLTRLLKRVFDETRIERVRVSSLNPVEITDPMLRLMEREPRFCPHFHVSLQSPHPRILRLMKRKYGAAEAVGALRAIARLAAPLGGVFVGMDVITGFPGETEAEFEESAAMLSELPWSRLHVFPYSERAGTPATRISGAVPREQRARRARRLTELSRQRLERFYGGIFDRLCTKGEVLQGVLLEAAGRRGYTPNYLRVELEHPTARQNQLVSVRPIRLKSHPATGDMTILGQVVAVS